MQPLAVHHVSVNVTDVDAALAFYTDVLGGTVRGDRPDFGISGAWIGSLTALAPYQPIFLGLAGASIAAGFWSVYRRQAACARQDCGTPVSQRVTKAFLQMSKFDIAALQRAYDGQPAP